MITLFKILSPVKTLSPTYYKETKIIVRCRLAERPVACMLLDQVQRHTAKLRAAAPVDVSLRVIILNTTSQPETNTTWSQGVRVGPKWVRAINWSTCVTPLLNGWGTGWAYSTRLIHLTCLLNGSYQPVYDMTRLNR